MNGDIHDVSVGDQSLVDFLASCKGEKPVLIAGDSYHEIISKLSTQAKETKDTETKDALEKIVEGLMLPGTDYDISDDASAKEDSPDNVSKIKANTLEIANYKPEKKATRNRRKTPTSIDVLHTKSPDKIVINNSKLSQTIIQDIVDAGDVRVLVSKKNSNKEFDIIASMAFEETNLKIEGQQPYTAYDRAVLNAICSLWQAGNTVFTPSMVYCAMNGLSGSDEHGRRVSHQAIGAVTRSIEKQRVTRLTIDCTNQAPYYNGLNNCIFDDMMLSVRGVVRISQNGTKVKAYAFNNPNQPPILYEYSQSIGQVLSVPFKILDSSSVINNTDEIIVLREYIIRRIEGIKGENELSSNRITYQGVYKELAIDLDAMSNDTRKNTARRIRKNTKAILSHLKNKEYILDFEEYKDGKTIAGVQITI